MNSRVNLGSWCTATFSSDTVARFTNKLTSRTADTCRIWKYFLFVGSFAVTRTGRRRLANQADATAVMKLVNESMAKNFHIEDVSNIRYLIDTCILSIVQLDPQESVVGFLAVKDHPLLPSVHPSAWEQYIWTKYKTVEMTARNTLFIHLLCWVKPYGRELVDALLRSLFMHDSYIMHVAYIKTMYKYQLLMPGQSRCEGSFKRVTLNERGLPPEVMATLCVAERSEVCPRLRVRRAVEEDNDDLVPIINRHSKRLRELYGEFYISELIARHPESDRVLLVGEHQELAVGVIILNTTINYESLEEAFELSPFAGLRHMDGKSSVAILPRVPESAENVLERNMLWFMSEILRDGPARPTKKEDKKCLSWLPKEVVRKYDQSAYDVLAPYSMLSIDEDEEEFDIINIEQDLLRVPRSLSTDIDLESEAAVIMLKEAAKYTDDNMPAINEKDQDKPPPQVHDLQSMESDQYIRRLFQASKIVRYSGTPNAFLLEVFAMHPEYDERYGFDLLEAAFELFPDRDYCVLCLPSDQPAFPLLEHFTLVVPRHTREKFTNQSLYVAHVNSIRQCLSVRPVEPFDITSISHIMEQVPAKHTAFQLFEKSLVSDQLDAFMLMSQNQPVGMAVIGSLDNVVAVRTQYNLEPESQHPESDGVILAAILSPALEPHSRWYLRDVLRLTKYTHLFWLCQLVTKDSLSSWNIMSLTGRLAPVTPNRCSVPNISGNEIMDKALNKSPPFAVWYMDKPLTALPKVDVNNGIVVVGASRTGLAFIEALIMGPASRYLTFTNITLVSKHGLPMATNGLRAAEICFPSNGRYTDRYLKSIPFSFYVDCMNGVMVGINRKKKCIYLKDGSVKYYDELVLTCGRQFQHPEYLADSFEDVKKIKKGLPCERVLMDDPSYRPDRVPLLPDLPDNVFLINSLYDANVCLRKLMRMIKSADCTDGCLRTDNRVVVYGDCLEAYSTIAALLELGIRSDQIAFVEPFPPEDRFAMRVNCFNNEIIDERVQNRIEELGIEVYRECRFLEWRMIEFRIDAIEVMAPLKRIHIPCFAFFYYGLKAINYYAFKAITECGLVYDGGLIVGPSFKTNDPHVYGAGTCVQYSRRLRAKRQLHRNYCSEDVGDALAEIFLNQMDPFVMADPATYSADDSRYKASLLNCIPHPSIEPLTRESLEKHREWAPVSEFESPLTYWAILPGPLYYLRVRKPGPEIPMEVELTLPNQGHLLTTDKNGNYFALRLNRLHCVESITCLSKKVPSYELLSQIYGIHESMFNKLLTRYKMNKIDDFYEYFIQPWMTPLYQEAFGVLLRQISRDTVFDLIKSHFSLDQDSEIIGDEKNFLCQCGLGNIVESKSVPSIPDSPTPSISIFGPGVSKWVKTIMDKEECGQGAKLRGEAQKVWIQHGGDSTLIDKLARYLTQYRIQNSHFAKIRLDDD